MKMVSLSYPLSIPNDQLPNCIAAIGFFDGIHKGHQQVIKRAVKKAKENEMESAVITFHPHPSTVLKKSNKLAQYITPLQVKKRLLECLQVDRMYVIQFNKPLSLMAPEQFINTYIKQLQVKHLIAGFDFTYGYKGAGNMKNLHEFTNDTFTFETIEKYEIANEKVSSTRIRHLLKEGNIEEINHLLGRKLTVTGEVVVGDKRGRTIGFPTANLKVNVDYLLPKIGVYAVEVCYGDHIYFGMANLGVVPTFKKGAAKLSLEVHIFNFDQTIYGDELTIKWHKFIRDEQAFSSVDELINQLQKDEKEVKEYFDIN